MIEVEGDLTALRSQLSALQTSTAKTAEIVSHDVV
jgi:hypothetical protein